MPKHKRYSRRRTQCMGVDFGGKRNMKTLRRAKFSQRQLYFVGIVTAVIGAAVLIRSFALATPCATSVEFQFVPGIGNACRQADGLYRVLVNGVEHLTH